MQACWKVSVVQTRMGKNCDMSGFVYRIIVRARQGRLSISETADLLVSRVDRGWCKNENNYFEWQVYEQKSFVDERDQRMARMVSADR